MSNNIKNILLAADKVIGFPGTTLRDACREYGVKISPNTGKLVGGLIFNSSPILMTAIWVVGKIKKTQREKEEKERMKNEIIRKQQAIIRKLHRENELNQQEIKNLKDTLEMLENAFSQIDAA